MQYFIVKAEKGIWLMSPNLELINKHIKGWSDRYGEICSIDEITEEEAEKVIVKMVSCVYDTQVWYEPFTVNAKKNPGWVIIHKFTE